MSWCAAMHGRRSWAIREPEEKIQIALDDLQIPGEGALAGDRTISGPLAEDGIDGFTVALQLRQIVAMQHWQGHPKYTLGDAIQSLVKTS